METLIKNLHTFVSIARNKSCTSIGLATHELLCCYELTKTVYHKCNECIFGRPDTKDTLSAIKIIGEHSERIN